MNCCCSCLCADPLQPLLDWWNANFDLGGFIAGSILLGVMGLILFLQERGKH